MRLTDYVIKSSRAPLGRALLTWMLGMLAYFIVFVAFFVVHSGAYASLSFGHLGHLVSGGITFGAIFGSILVFLQLSAVLAIVFVFGRMFSRYRAVPIPFSTIMGPILTHNIFVALGILSLLWGLSEGTETIGKWAGAIGMTVFFVANILCVGFCVSRIILNAKK